MDAPCSSARPSSSNLAGCRSRPASRSNCASTSLRGPTQSGLLVLTIPSSSAHAGSAATTLESLVSSRCSCGRLASTSRRHDAGGFGCTIFGILSPPIVYFAGTRMGPTSRPSCLYSPPTWATATSSPRTSISTPPPNYSERQASASSERMAPSSLDRKRSCTVSSGNSLAGHLRTFFHDHLIAQRNVSPHTVLAYRDAIKLLLVFAAERLRKPVARLGFEDLEVETVLGFLEYLENDRNNSVATRNARLAALHVFYQHV